MSCCWFQRILVGLGHEGPVVTRTCGRSRGNGNACSPSESHRGPRLALALDEVIDGVDAERPGRARTAAIGRA